MGLLVPVLCATHHDGTAPQNSGELPLHVYNHMSQGLEQKLENNKSELRPFVGMSRLSYNRTAVPRVRVDPLEVLLLCLNQGSVVCG